MTDFKFLQPTADIAGLAWGMHRNFRDYIQAMSDGQMQVLQGAQLLDSNEAFFPIDHQNSTATHLRFSGTLQFVGHRGLLAVAVQQPWLDVAQQATSLTIVDPFDQAARMALVTVALEEDGTGTTRLTEDGTDLFMGNYRENITFDPVRIVWAGKD